MNAIRKMLKKTSVTLVAALILAVVLFVSLILVYINVYKKTQDNLISDAENRITMIAENTDAFLQKAKTVVASNAGSVEHMFDTGVTNSEILDFLLYHTDTQLAGIDVNFTGVYGYYRGEYLDGNRWDPYADGGVYYPKERPWYLAALDGKGEVSFASPYLDMDTGNVVLSVTKLLKDGESVLGLDVSLVGLSSSVNTYMEDNNFVLAYIIDSTGTIVASKNPAEAGLNYLTTDAAQDSQNVAELFRKVLATDETFEYDVDGHTHLAFSRTIEHGWQVILLTDADSVYAPLRQMARNCAILLVLLVLLLVYFTVSSFRDRKKAEATEVQNQQYVLELQDTADHLANYKRAILSDALISLEVNLSTDELYYGVWKDDSGKEVPLNDILGIALPCSYDTYIRLWNDRFVKNDFGGSFFGSTDREHLLNTYRNGLSEVTFDYEARTISGRSTWLRRSICMTANQSGDIIAFTSVKDISALVAANKREEAYIRALSTEYDSIAVVNFEAEAKNDTISIHSRISPEFKKLVTPEFLAETNFSKRVALLRDMVLPEDRDAFYRGTNRDAILASFEAQKTHIVDFRMPTPDGDSIYYQERFIAIRDEEGRLEGMIACLRNIDTEIRAEFGRRRELEEAKTAAEAASMAKSTFLFNMSHDIRTPMNAILGFTRIARKHVNEAEEVDSCLNKIEVSGEQLLDLINDVLEMSRIESGRVTMEYEPFCVSDAFTKIDPMFESLALTKSIDYAATIGSVENNYVWADTFHMSRIFTNIITNAIKYTPAGGRVRASFEQVAPAAENVGRYLLTVEDTGIGMSPDFLDHMFEEFAREKSTTMSRQTGTGLGLAIVRKLTDALGGTITVHSEQGKGSKFEIEFPLRLETEAEIRENHAAGITVEAVNTIDDMLTGHRALLAEDNELNREIATEVLEEKGLTIEAAEDGKIAYEHYMEKDSGYYDFILMDIQMPVMNGYEATRKIRAYETANGLPRVPIIAVSANAFAEDIAQSLASGMDAHIAKPINPDELVKVMRSFVRKPRE